MQKANVFRVPVSTMNQQAFGPPVAFVCSVRVPSKLENAASVTHAALAAPATQGNSFAQTMSLAAKSAADSRANDEHLRKELAAKKPDTSSSTTRESLSNAQTQASPAAKPAASPWSLDSNGAHDQAMQQTASSAHAENAQSQDQANQQTASTATAGTVQGLNDAQQQAVAVTQTNVVQGLTQTSQQGVAASVGGAKSKGNQDNQQVVAAAQTGALPSLIQLNQPTAATTQSGDAAVLSRVDDRATALQSGPAVQRAVQSASQRTDGPAHSAAQARTSDPATPAASAKDNAQSHAEQADASGETVDGVEQAQGAQGAQTGDPTAVPNVAGAISVPSFSALSPGTAEDSTLQAPEGVAAATAKLANGVAKISAAGDSKPKAAGPLAAPASQPGTPSVSPLFSAAAGNAGENKGSAQPGGNGEAMQQIAQASAPQSAGTTGFESKLHTDASGNAPASPLPSAAASDAPEVAAAKTVLNTSQLIQSMHSSEMRLGMNSAEFGAISISTSISHQVLSASISLGHAELSRALAQQMPAMQEKLSSTYGVQARVEMRDANATTQQQGGSRQNRQEPASQGSSSISSMSSALPSATAAFSSSPSISLASGSTRLDVLY